MLQNVDLLVRAENYSDWAIKKGSYLNHEDVFDTIKVSTGNVSTDADKVRLAKSKIIMSVDSRVHSELHGLSTPKEMWDKLEAVYASRNMYRKTAHIIEYTQIKLSNFDSVNEYIDKIESTHQSLKKIGKDPGDYFAACIMLAGLPEKYESMRMTLQSLPEAGINAANMKEKLRSLIN